MTQCNMCGELVGCVRPDHKKNGEKYSFSCQSPEIIESALGLHNITVSGGYFSTPGNGCGALDDCSQYKFSLCEFCLDWLFCQMKIKPEVMDYQDGTIRTFIPAHQRVREDEWRRSKEEFYKEAERRAQLRGKK